MAKKILYILLTVLLISTLSLTACKSAEEPVGEEPVGEEPAGEEPAGEESAGEEPAGDEEEEESEAVKTSAKDVLVIGNINDVGTMDPYGVSAMQRGRVTTNIYDMLFLITSTGEYIPRLATDWEWTDELHVVFHLREGVVFHNGEEFNAEDVIFTLNYAATNENWATYFTKVDLENSKAIDDFTVEIAFSEPDGIFMPSLSMVMPILDKTTTEADPEAKANGGVGTGAYKFVEWITGDSVTLERFDDYWGEPAPIKTVIFRSIPEITQRSIELQTGGIDVAYDLGATDALTIEEDPNLSLLRMPGRCVHNLHFNSSEGHVFANEDLRKAAAYAISAADILQGAYDGAGTVANSYCSNAVPGYNYDLTEEPYPQDLEKAKEYFEASGVPEGTKIKIIVDDRAYRIATTEIIKNQLAAIGLDAEIQQFDFSTGYAYAQDVTNDWDIYPLAQCQSNASMQAARLTDSVKYVTFPDTPAGADMLALIREILSETDVDKAQQMNDDLQVMVNERLALYPVAQAETLFGYNAKLSGMDEANINQTIIAQYLYFEP